MTKREIIQMLSKDTDLDEPVAFMLWVLEDVLSLMNKDALSDFGLAAFTPEELDVAREVLDQVHHNQDASLGISWHTLEQELAWQSKIQ